MDDWEDFNEATLPKKEEFYTSFNMEEITDVDYMHVKRSCKDFEIKKLGQYHDLADVFENKKNLLKNYKLDPGKFLSVLGLTWKAALKKTEVKSELLTDIDMLLMV